MVNKKKTTDPLISLIIPAYRQERTIQRDLMRIKNLMDVLEKKYEIIVVVDGMQDKTLEKARRVKGKGITAIGYQNNYGKGYAVRFGMTHAKGDIIGFIDSGMDINPHGISMLLEHFEWYDADIIVGSKLHPVSKIDYPFSRKVLSWGYRMMVKMLFGLSIRDTQVGLKFYKRQVLETVLPRLLVKQYAFDIEILAVAYYLGFKRIYEGPIELDFTGVSSIATKGFIKTIWSMLIDTFAVFYRLKIMHYYDNNKKRKWEYNRELDLRVNLP